MNSTVMRNIPTNYDKVSAYSTDYESTAEYLSVPWARQSILPVQPRTFFEHGAEDFLRHRYLMPVHEKA